MNRKRKDLYKYPLSFLLAAGTALISVSVFTVLSMSIDKVIALVSLGEIDFSYVALLIVSVFMAVTGTWCFSQWNNRRSYIYVSDSHKEVIPVDRREDYFQLSL